MPGKKMSGIKRPKQYEALRRKGMSKGKAARVSNSDSKASGGPGMSPKKAGAKGGRATARKHR